MVQAALDTSTWDRCEFKKLMPLLERAKEAKKYLFIWDKQGSLATFYQYKGCLAQLGPPTMRALLGQGTNADIAEEIRKKWIYAMRGGDNLCLDIASAKCNFPGCNTEGTFIAE